MFGSVDAWFYNTLAGIRPDPEKPGFEHIIIKPYNYPRAFSCKRCSTDSSGHGVMQMGTGEQ